MRINMKKEMKIKRFGNFITEDNSETLSEYLLRKIDEYLKIEKRIPLSDNFYAQQKVLYNFLVDPDSIRKYNYANNNIDEYKEFNRVAVPEFLEKLKYSSEEEIIKTLKIYSDVVINTNINNGLNENAFALISLTKEILDFAIETNKFELFKFITDHINNNINFRIDGDMLYKNVIKYKDVIDIKPYLRHLRHSKLFFNAGVRKLLFKKINYTKLPTYKILINELGFVDSSTQKIKDNGTLRLLLNDTSYYTIYSDGTIRLLYINGSTPRIYKKTNIVIRNSNNAEQVLQEFLQAYLNITKRKLSKYIKQLANKDIKSLSRVKPVTIENLRIIIDEILKNITFDFNHADLYIFLNTLDLIAPGLINNEKLKILSKHGNAFLRFLNSTNSLNIIEEMNIDINDTEETLFNKFSDVLVNTEQYNKLFSVVYKIIEYYKRVSVEYQKFEYFTLNIIKNLKHNDEDLNYKIVKTIIDVLDILQEYNFSNEALSNILKSSNDYKEFYYNLMKYIFDNEEYELMFKLNFLDYRYIPRNVAIMFSLRE